MNSCYAFDEKLAQTSPFDRLYAAQDALDLIFVYSVVRSEDLHERAASPPKCYPAVIQGSPGNVEYAAIILAGDGLFPEDDKGCQARCSQVTVIFQRTSKRSAGSEMTVTLKGIFFCDGLGAAEADTRVGQ